MKTDRVFDTNRTRTEPLTSGRVRVSVIMPTPKWKFWNTEKNYIQQLINDLVWVSITQRIHSSYKILDPNMVANPFYSSSDSVFYINTNPICTLLQHQATNPTLKFNILVKDVPTIFKKLSTIIFQFVHGGRCFFFFFFWALVLARGGFKHSIQRLSRSLKHQAPHRWSAWTSQAWGACFCYWHSVVKPFFQQLHILTYDRDFSSAQRTKQRLEIHLKQISAGKEWDLL